MMSAFNSSENDMNSPLDEIPLHVLRRKIEEGVRQIESGECIHLHGDDELKEFFEDIKRRGEERAAARRRSKETEGQT
jgi:hypothetical protein